MVYVRVKNEEGTRAGESNRIKEFMRGKNRGGCRWKYFVDEKSF